MRKTVTTLFAAAALTAAFAQPAAADPCAGGACRPAPPPAVASGVKYEDLSDADTLARSCQTRYQAGVLWQYDAWGYFIPGCKTGTLRCPTGAPHGGPAHGILKCQLRATSIIGTAATRNHQVTLNQRVTVVSPEGARSWHDDRRCAGRNGCRANLGGYEQNVDCHTANGGPCPGFVYINPGETAEVECNGVREHGMGANTARVQCKLYVDSILTY
jgi:hypothetical protein